MPGTDVHVQFDKYLVKRGHIQVRRDYRVIHKLMDNFKRGDAWWDHHKLQPAHDPAFIRALVSGEDVEIEDRIQEKVNLLLEAVAEAGGHRDDFIMAAYGHAALDYIYRAHHLNSPKKATVKERPYKFARDQAIEYMAERGWCSSPGE